MGLRLKKDKIIININRHPVCLKHLSAPWDWALHQGSQFCLNPLLNPELSVLEVG